MMNDSITISVNASRFYAFHGYHVEEKQTGNEFEVDLSVEIIPGDGTITGIGETVNYVSLYEILQEEMQKPRTLLETLAMEIATVIHQRFPDISRLSISIQKLNPPIHQFTGRVGVRYVKTFR